MVPRSSIQRSLGSPPSGLKSRAPTQIPLRRQAQLTLYIQNPTSKIQNDEAPDSFESGASFTTCPGVARKGGDGWQLSTPGARDSERRPRRSCVAAETGRGTAFALGFPIGGSLRCPCSIGNEIHTACGRYPALPDDIHACGVDDICEPGLANDEAPKPFRFRGFIYPGSYLLSRDLSSDYHRRADVSLPGSEWDRVGPSGYDHQASVLNSSAFLLTS